MIAAVSIVGFVLLLIAASDRRARLMAALIALVWLETALVDVVMGVDSAVIMRGPIDFVGAVMTLGLVTRERWSLAVPALFAAMLACHAGYWLAWHNGYDLWYTYANTLNVLWLCQLAAVAWPPGGNLIGHASAYMGSSFSDGRALGCSHVVRDYHRQARKVAR